MPNCLVVQHVVPEPAFAIADALVAADVHVDTRRAFAGDDIPAEVSGFDGVVVMGGPMSATSRDGFPSLDAELSLLNDALSVGVPTLGICLGAQILALAGGGAVARNSYGPEIGWAPVHLAPACLEDRLFAGLPPTIDVLHWHGESFDVPPSGQLLMSSDAYPNQAFRLGDVAWGLQFHLEVTQAAVDGFLHAFGEEAAEAPGGADVIRADSPDTLRKLAPVRELVCSRFAALVAERVVRGDLVDQE